MNPHEKLDEIPIVILLEDDVRLLEEDDRKDEVAADSTTEVDRPDRDGTPPPASPHPKRTERRTTPRVRLKDEVAADSIAEVDRRDRDGTPPSASPHPKRTERRAPRRARLKHKVAAHSITAVDRRDLHDTSTPASPVSKSTPDKTRRQALLSRCLYIAGSCAAAAVVAIVTFVGYLIVDGGYIAAYYPSPGRLSSPHHRLTEGPDATDCHSCHALMGVSSGCLGCHEEIARQLDGDDGFHHYLFEQDDRECFECHREHRGAESLLVDEHSWSGQDLDDFRHPHVAFRLTDRHRELGCEACHREKLRGEFTLPGFPSHPREHTFLGLQQECVFCHEDIHSGGLSTDCESCHDQKAFRPAPHFDHSQHFSLEGAHSRVACNRCHVIPEVTTSDGTRLKPFSEVRGTLCADCHQSPHRTPFDSACESCHRESPDSWITGREGMTAEIHDRTGFSLLPQHTQVDCLKCHEPGRSYEERFPDPTLAAYLRFEDTCQGCHVGVHDGQFLGKSMECLDCHERERFQPHRFTPERHESVFALVDAHAQAPCEGCHLKKAETEARVFVGTSRECQSCHQSPHGGQFDAGGKRCSDCHDTKLFLPAQFGQIQHETAFPLTGSHRAVPCIACHARDAVTDVRKFIETPRACRTCHESPHGPQFASELKTGDCTTCHREDAVTFAIRPFDHGKRTGYPLTGAHASARCNQCHIETESASDKAPAAVVRIYRNTSTQCSWCHRDVHRGQFRENGETDCTRCHVSSEVWKEIVFDHQSQSRFRLDGSHIAVPCGRCHTAAELDDGAVVQRFKPMGMECHDCHTVKSD